MIQTTKLIHVAMRFAIFIIVGLTILKIVVVCSAICIKIVRVILKIVIMNKFEDRSEDASMCKQYFA